MRSNKSQCCAIRRYFLFCTAIALLPLALVYLVTNEQIYKIKGYEFEEPLDPGPVEQRAMVSFPQKRRLKIRGNSRKTLAETSFRYPLMILGPLKELARRAAGSSGTSTHKSNKRHKEGRTVSSQDERQPFESKLLTTKHGFIRKFYTFSNQENDMPGIKTSQNSSKIASSTTSKEIDSVQTQFENETKLQTLPDEVIRTLSPNEMDLVEQRMKSRRKLLQQKCHEHGLDRQGRDEALHKPNPWEFLVNNKYHLIWCNVFKAASSSWMYNFNILAGYSPEFLHKTSEVPLVLARKKYPRVSLDELREAQNDSITFIIARHPFERLLSAYRDKFIFAVPHSFHDKLGMKIVRAYRKNKAERNSPKHPTFSEFVSWLLDEVKRKNYIDMHLVPATKFCTPCLIHFDVIAKFETLEEDQIYLIERAGLQNVIMPEWKNSGKGKNTLDLLQTYYSQLTKKQLDGLYNYFKYDFEIFGYDPAPYFDMVKYDDHGEKGKTKMLNRI